MNVDKAWKDIPPEVKNFPLMTAWEFLYNNGPITWSRPTLELLKNVEIAAKLAASPQKIERRKLGNRQAVMIKIEGGVDRFLGIPMAYEVALDEKAAMVPFFGG